MSFFYWGAHSWTRHWSCISPVLSIGNESPPFTCLQNSFLRSSRYCWLLLTQGHTAGSYSTWYSPAAPSPFMQSCFSDSWCMGVIHMQMQDFAFSFVELCGLPVRPFLQPVEILLNSNTSIWSIICKFAEIVLCHILQVLNEVLNSTGPSIDS